MIVSKNQNPEFIRVVKGNLEGSRYYKYVDRIVTEILKDYRTYLWGGAARDPIVRQFYGREVGETKDFDILVDDSKERINFRKLLKDLGGIFSTRFGSPKWKPENGLEIDIVPFSNATRLRNGEELPISLDTALMSCEFTTSALAYDLRDEIIYSCRALEGIRRQEIDLLYPKGEEPHILMCRLVLQSEKLGFIIGNKAKKLIIEGYNPDLESHIERYMEYKGIQDKCAFIVGRLRDIQAFYE